VHVYDQFGNDLPDYEVVYLLENIGTTLNSGGQLADATYLPNAYFMDIDTDNDGDDQNGPRPDADEPTPGSDPYATIEGDGGTEAFYFNQWLGAAIPGTVTAERKNTDEGHPGWVRGAITDVGLTLGAAHVDGPPFGPPKPGRSTATTTTAKRSSRTATPAVTSTCSWPSTRTWCPRPVTSSRS